MPKFEERKFNKQYWGKHSLEFRAAYYCDNAKQYRSKRVNTFLYLEIVSFDDKEVGCELQA